MEFPSCLNMRRRILHMFSRRISQTISWITRFPFDIARADAEIFRPETLRLQLQHAHHFISKPGSSAIRPTTRPPFQISEAAGSPCKGHHEFCCLSDISGLIVWQIPRILPQRQVHGQAKKLHAEQERAVNEIMELFEAWLLFVSMVIPDRTGFWWIVALIYTAARRIFFKCSDASSAVAGWTKSHAAWFDRFWKNLGSFKCDLKLFADCPTSSLLQPSWKCDSNSFDGVAQ